MASGIWQSMGERSEVSCIRAINKKLDRYVAECYTECPNNFSAIYDMPSSSYLKLDDLKKLALGKSVGDKLTDTNKSNVTEEAIKNAAKDLSAYVKDCFTKQQAIHESLARIESHGNNHEKSDKVVLEANTALNDAIKEYYQFKTKKDNKLYQGCIDALISRQAGDTNGRKRLLGKDQATPKWAGFAQQFEYSSKPKTFVSKCLKYLPDSMARSRVRILFSLITTVGIEIGLANAAFKLIKHMYKKSKLGVAKINHLQKRVGENLRQEQLTRSFRLLKKLIMWCNAMTQRKTSTNVIENT